jgi:hypothetical protein
MPQIRPIGIDNINIPEVGSWYTNQPQAIPLAPPVTLNIGVPIVDIPGCVEAHETNSKSRTIAGDDPKGLVTYCDGNLPNYNPINFEPEQIIPTPVPKVDTRQREKEKEDNIDAAGAASKINTIKCKPDEILNLQLNRCEKIQEPITETPSKPWVEEYLPPLGAVTTTATIALVATTSALAAKPLADLLLKAVKPTVKKVVKKIAAIRGKTVPVESVWERRDQQRIRSHAIRKLKGKE